VVDSARFLFAFSLVPSLQTGGSMFHIASAGGDGGHLEALLQDDDDDGAVFADDASVNLAKPSDGMTPLHFAATTGSLDAGAVLLERGADAEATSNSGATPLMIAATMGHVDFIRLLVKKGRASPDTAHSWSGVTALHLAAEMGHTEVVRFLCGGASRKSGDGDGDDEETPFLMPPANTAARKTNGGTPLHTAADTNQTEVVKVGVPTGPQSLSLSCPTPPTPRYPKCYIVSSLTLLDVNPSAHKILVHECLCDTLALLEGDTTAVYLAAQRGFAEVVQVLTEDRDLLNFVMPEGMPGMNVAIVDTDGALDLGEFGGGGGAWYPPVNTEVGNGATALHVAVENGHVDVVKVFLKEGAAQLPSMQGVTPLLLSLGYHHPHIALLLLDNLLSDAKYAKKKERVNLINLQAPNDGSFPLFLASGSGYSNVVRALLDASADIDLSNSFGATALSNAVFNGHVDVAAQLLNHDKPPKSVDAPLDDGTTTLHVACERGNVALFQMLLAAGADPSARTVQEWRTPLHYASEGRNEDIVASLLGQKVNPNAAVKSTGSTPLHMSAKIGAVKVSRLLLKHGAEPSSQGSEAIFKATPLHLAAQNGHEKVVKLLLKYKADVDSRLAQVDVTPLFIAVERGHVGVVKALLKQGADANVQNAHAITALHMAVMQNQLPSLKLLLKKGADYESIDGKYSN
jgi:ankyrin repeat protein